MLLPPVKAVNASERTLTGNLFFAEDGRLKYKVHFELKGKSLVSGHHIAFDKTPKLDELYVGARLAIQSQENKSLFQPGVLAELPARKNHSRSVSIYLRGCDPVLCQCLIDVKTLYFFRFLVFIDDHRPEYVGLPQLHLVCRPCKFT